MTDQDTGPSITQLRGSAWFLIVVALGSICGLVLRSDDIDALGVGELVWAVVAVVAAVFSAACVVLVGVKEAEGRLVHRLLSGRQGRPGEATNELS